MELSKLPTLGWLCQDAHVLVLVPVPPGDVPSPGEPQWVSCSLGAPQGSGLFASVSVDTLV